MMRTILLATLIAFPFILSAQKDAQIDSILSKPLRQIETYDTTGFGEFQLAIRFPYGSPRILNAGEYDSIRALSKVRVEYIYTEYTQSQPGQASLDRARFAALKRLAPDLFTDAGVGWEIVVQTSAKRAKEATNLFHGFVITYQPERSKERMAQIEHQLDMLVSCAKKQPPADSPKYPGGADSLRAWVKRSVLFPAKELTEKGSNRMALVEFRIDTATGKPVDVRVSRGASKTHNETIKKIVQGMPSWKTGGSPDVEFSLLIRFDLTADGLRETEISPLRGYKPKECQFFKPDPTISNALTRNREKWKKMLIVEDVTGSMIPYVADLLIWNSLRSNMENTGHFVFFNDGDAKEDFEKEIGCTGGIYHVRPKSLTELEKMMVKAIAGGTGGDTRENDMEAVLAGIEACPDCTDIILIADNNATPRDLSLLEKVGKPIHVILCGIQYAPNPAHLGIAWKTKGSVHTLQQDITELAKMQEGDSIKVMGQLYRIINGKLVEISRE